MSFYVLPMNEPLVGSILFILVVYLLVVCLLEVIVTILKGSTK